MKQPVTDSTKSKSSRVLAFDFLRGYFMLSIVLNHLQWYPNGYDWVAMRGSLLVSAAEGFFLISGIVLGIVRGQKLLKKPFREAAFLLVKRGVLLYAISVILALMFTLIGWQFFMDSSGLKPGIRPLDQPFWEVLFGIMNYKYIYGWADFLRLYSIFLMISPLALWLLRKGWWYVLLIFSTGLWALYPFLLEKTGQSAELLMLFSWQFIFFGGFIIGFYWHKLSAFWQKPTSKKYRFIGMSLVALGGITLLANVGLEVVSRLGWVPQELTTAALRPHFIKEQLPIWRLGLFLLWFWFGFYTFNKFEKPIKKFFGWILLPFGQNSLYVYILHAIILFFVHIIYPPTETHNALLNFAGTSLILAFILLAIKKQFLFKIIPR